MEAKPGRIITFYSYKGGTGRTMALANVACLLARRPEIERGVLAIDWDLEAPGLHWFFRSGDTGGLADESQHKGVIELFCLLDSEIQRHTEGELGEETVQEIVSKIPLEEFISSTPASGVHLMPAGSFDPHYGERVSQLQWRALFHRAPSLIRFVAELLASKYDYILVDSRTGVNDTSGICTALLPDQLVLVFTANHQSLVGGIEAVRTAALYRMRSDDLRRLSVFPLPSRIELSEPELLEKWRFGDANGEEDQQGYQSRLEALFKDVYGLTSCSLKNYLDEVQIQHVPRYSYGEEIAVLHERRSRLSISRSYATATDILATGQSPWTVSPAGPLDEDPKPGQPRSSAKMDAAKEYLSESRFRLKLRDLVTSEIKFVLKRVERLGPQENPTPTTFAARLTAYESVTNDLMHIQALLGYWGDAEQRDLIGLGAKRVCDQIPLQGGMTIWVYSRWYPALLLLYSGGIAAVAGRRYDNLRDLMLTPVSYPYESSDTEPTLIHAVAAAMLELDRTHIFDNLPGLERRYTPRSEHLFRLLGPVLDDSLFLGSEYADAFDRFEALYALEYAHRHDRGAENEFRYWAPPGRFAWQINRGKHPLEALVTEAAAEGKDWGPLRAGLFSGSVERFKEVEAGYRQLLRRSSWR